MNKKEIVIVLLILMGSILFIIFNKNSEDKDYISVYHVEDDEQTELTRIDLSKNDIYEIEVELGTMVIEVKDGKYGVVDVDCPQHICQKQGFVSPSDLTSSIICLPNHIVIEPS